MSLHVEHSVPASPAKDIRGQSVDKLRAKERRVKYRWANRNRIGTPINMWHEALGSRENAQVARWTYRNAWKMEPLNARCTCKWCSDRTKGSDHFSHYEDITLPRSKKCRSTNTRRDPNDVDEWGPDDDLSLMQTEIDTQLALSHAVAQAVEKFEIKELNNLVKNEYEVIATPCIDADDFVFV